MMKYLQMMSVNEKKFSVLVLVLLILVAVICIKYIIAGIVAEGMVTMFGLIVGAITGINIAEQVKETKIEVAKVENDLNNNGIPDDQEFESESDGMGIGEGGTIQADIQIKKGE